LHANEPLRLLLNSTWAQRLTITKLNKVAVRIFDAAIVTHWIRRPTFILLLMI